MDHFKGSEPENPITTCISLLSARNFTAAIDFARRLPLSDSIGRILTIADVLSAADHYSVLRLRRSESVNRDLARQHYAKFAILLDPTSSEKFPFQDEALARVREAWHVLSDPERRAVYDHSGGAVDTATAATFWTACPYCWNLYQYEKKYEGCSLTCQSCMKSFHGVAVKSPVKVGGAVVEGEERRQYYKCRARVPLKFYEVKDGNESFMGEDSTEFVYVSDDDGDWEKEWGNVGGGGVRNEGFEKVIQENQTVEMQGNEKRKTRIKTVARKSVGSRMTRFDFGNNDLGLDGKDCELEFTEGDDDVFVGVRFND